MRSRHQKLLNIATSLESQMLTLIEPLSHTFIETEISFFKCFHFEPSANDNLGLDLFLPNNFICFTRSSSSCCFFLLIASSFCLWSSSSSRYRSSSLRCCSKASFLWLSSILLRFSSSILSSSSFSFRACSCTWTKNWEWCLTHWE